MKCRSNHAKRILQSMQFRLGGLQLGINALAIHNQQAVFISGLPTKVACSRVACSSFRGASRLEEFERSFKAPSSMLPGIQYCARAYRGNSVASFADGRGCGKLSIA